MNHHRNLITTLLAGILFAPSVTADNLTIARTGGDIVLIPMSDNAIRVKIDGQQGHTTDELIYVNPQNVESSISGNTLKVKNLTATYDSTADAITFINADGNVILREVEHSRISQPSTIQNEPTTISGQRFHSPADEYIYGTGQFQDGYLNLRGLSRRLTQVNTQISIPFILSNKGYGLLWNNYGLTELNPASDSVSLTPAGTEGDSFTVDITTSTGNARETRSVNAFEGEMNIPETGEYCLLLDVGQRMARKYKLSVDGKVLVDFNNLWLPPTTSLMTTLDKGKHRVRVEGESHDAPTLHWRKNINETELRSPVSTGIDYTVFSGTPDEVIASYRQLTGPAPMMPQWTLGYIHCRERFDSQKELLENADEFRRRQIPIDVIVQDWQYWGRHGWNAMCFDLDKYPDPKLMVDSLHDADIRLMISVWSKLDVNSEVGKVAKERGYLLPGSEWVDFFNPEAAGYYWDNFSSRLLKPYGIDAWWQDATEPENDDLQGRRINGGKLPGEVYRNAFPLFVNRTVYEGLRKDAPHKRAMILTRSGFPGMQRYAAATWSGDVGHDWETLRRQITGGLGQMVTGLPWGTFDAGGFFRPGHHSENVEYKELLLRWLQVGTFLPLMRVHGYMSNTEPWRYGNEVDSVARKFIGMRYELMPYIYSVSASVSRDGYTMMRPLVMDFTTDENALQQKYEYMFGPSLLVSPIVEGGVKEWSTYLPEGCGWYDFRNGKRYDGGTIALTKETIATIPVFAKAGSIIPMKQAGQFAADNADSPIDLHVYPGADCTFTLYEDEGDNYNYEKGAFSTIPIIWEDSTRRLTIGKRKGEFDGMQKKRIFNVILPDGTSKRIEYSGSKRSIRI